MIEWDSGTIGLAVVVIVILGFIVNHFYPNILGRKDKKTKRKN